MYCHPTSQSGAKNAPVLSNKESAIVTILRENGNLKKEQIALKQNVPFLELSEVLFQLEIKDVIKCLPGGLFELKI